jgi:hypothetical protein
VYEKRRGMGVRVNGIYNLVTDIILMDYDVD